MKRFLLGALLLSITAWAGDKLLGVVLVTDGGTVNNASTGYGSAGCASQTSLPSGAGACAQAFNIGTSILLSVQCKDQSAMFAANVPTVDAGQGIKLAADQFLTSSTGSSPITVSLPDGGSYRGGLVAISPIAGGSRAECNIFQRTGNE